VSEYPRIPIAALRRQDRAARGALTRAVNSYYDRPRREAEARVHAVARKADIARARLDAALSQEGEVAA
jgi:hypothetical protein